MTWIRYIGPAKRSIVGVVGDVAPGSIVNVPDHLLGRLASREYELAQAPGAAKEPSKPSLLKDLFDESEGPGRA